MIIGIDFDGTIANTNAAKSAWIQRELGERVAPYLCDRTSCVPIIGESDYNRMSAVVYSRETTLGLQPVAGVLQAFSGLKKNHNLLVVTARYGEMLKSAQAWLSRYSETSGLRLVGRSNDKISKATMCQNEGVQVLVDDDERHLYPTMEMGIKGVLFKQDAPKDFQCRGLYVCRSWEEFVLLMRDI